MESGSITKAIAPTSLPTTRSKWLKDERDPNKPFILMCQHKAPHRNWSPPERHFSLYKDVDVPEPETLFDDYAGRSELLKQNEMSLDNHFYWGHDMKFHGENLLSELVSLGDSPTASTLA